MSLATGINTSVIPLGETPGRITPGMAREITNQEMTEYNDLRRAGVLNPHILQMVARHFVQGTGRITELLMMLKKDYNPMAAAARMKSKKHLSGIQDWNDMRMSQNMMLIDNYEFAWRIQTPTGYVYRIVNTVNESVVGSGQTGFGGQEFPLTLNKFLGSMDDVILLNDGNTQLIITAPPVGNSDGTMTCRVKRLYSRQQAPYMDNIGVQVDCLTRGSECQIIYNIKPEKSAHGSRSRLQRGEWAREWMTTQRYEWDITGHAKAVKSNAKWFAFQDSNGKEHTYWVDAQNYEMMRMCAERRDNFLWYGLPNINKSGDFARDIAGNEYISGTGFYNQTNNRLKRTYNDLNDFSLIEGLMRDMNYDSQYKLPILLCAGGLEFRTKFGRLLRNEFKYAPQVLFVKDGDMIGAPAGTEGMGLQSNFNYLRTELGIFVVAPIDFFDNRWMPTRNNSVGQNEQSHRGIIINIADQTGGDSVDNVNMLSLPGRTGVIKDVNGMGGDQQVLSTTVDMMGRHMLDTAGIAVANPNCMAELRLARR